MSTQITFSQSAKRTSRNHVAITPKKADNSGTHIGASVLPKFACKTAYDGFGSLTIFGSKYRGLRALHARTPRPNLTKTI